MHEPLAVKAEVPILHTFFNYKTLNLGMKKDKLLPQLSLKRGNYIPLEDNKSSTIFTSVLTLK